MDTPISFGLWIRQRRKALDLTQAMLAERVGCSVSAIRKLESDERRPSREVAELLAEALAIEQLQRPIFLKVARSELRVERLAAVPPIATAPRPLVEPQSTPPSTHLPAPLPVPPTLFIGRAAELAELTRLLDQPDCRLLTLTGAGGMGKTRLALAVAIEQQTAFAHGVAFVALAALASPDFMAPALATALGFTFFGPTEPKTQVLNYLRDKQMLLVLDNLEHLLDGVSFLTELLEACAGMKLLATSRERLDLQGEWIFNLHGLPTPPLDWLAVHAPDPIQPQDAVALYSAVALFVKSACRVQANFVLSAQNQVAIAHICRLVDGMPLGIELAAGWVHILSCQEIAQEIERSIGFLTTNGRDVPTRHRSLTAVFAHSWQLLKADEQRVMQQLSLFRGGFTREAAKAVAGASLPILASLVAKSLVQRAQDGRYALHELVRQYAAQRLEASDQAQATRNRSLEFFAQLAQQAGAQIGYAQHLSAIEQLETEMGNLRGALLWALESQQIERGLQLALALVGYWEVGGYWREGDEWLGKLLAAGDALPLRLRAQTLQGIGYLANSAADVKRGRQLLAQSMQLWQTLGNRAGIAELSILLGFVEKDHAKEQQYYEQGLALYRALDDKAGIANALLCLGIMASDAGDWGRATQCLAEGLALFRQIDNRIGIADTLRPIGVVAFQQGDYLQAQAMYEACLSLYRDLQFKRGIAASLTDLGEVALHLQAYARAKQLCREALVLANELNHKWDIAWSLDGLAQVAQMEEQAILAVQLLGASQSLFETVDRRLHAPDLVARERRIADLRHQLGAEAFATAWSQGRALALDKAIQLATQM